MVNKPENNTAQRDGGCSAVPKLAIACQGGGAHTAFTAGVLAYFFLAFQHFKASNQPLPVELTAISGTSGGAITAAMAWSEADSWALGARRVLHFWHLNKALPTLENPHPFWWFEQSLNSWAQWAASLGNVLPKTQLPSNPEISRQIKQRMVADMETAFGPACQGGAINGRNGMRIHVGACDIVNPAARPDTAFTAFPASAHAPLEIAQLLASAAIPEIFTPEEISIGGNPHFFWDGLFSQNPPINDFFNGRSKAEKPDLLWVIQINPSVYESSRGEAYPTLPLEVEDRRNELIGNLSLGHELNTIETINALYAEPPVGLNGKKPVTYCIIPLGRLNGIPLDYASKMNRDPDFIDALIRLGASTAYDLAKSGALLRPDSHLTGKRQHACSWSNPSWPSPGSLVKYLIEPELRGIWQGGDA